MIVKGVQEVEVSIKAEEFLNELSRKLIGYSLQECTVSPDGNFQTMELVNYHRGEYDWVDCKFQNPARSRKAKLLQDLYNEIKEEGIE